CECEQAASPRCARAPQAESETLPPSATSRAWETRSPAQGWRPVSGKQARDVGGARYLVAGHRSAGQAGPGPSLAALALPAGTRRGTDRLSGAAPGGERNPARSWRELVHLDGECAPASGRSRELLPAALFSRAYLSLSQARPALDESACAHGTPV